MANELLDELRKKSKSPDDSQDASEAAKADPQFWNGVGPLSDPQQYGGLLKAYKQMNPQSQAAPEQDQSDSEEWTPPSTPEKPKGLNTEKFHKIISKTVASPEPTEDSSQNVGPVADAGEYEKKIGNSIGPVSNGKNYSELLDQAKSLTPPATGVGPVSDPDQYKHLLDEYKGLEDSIAPDAAPPEGAAASKPATMPELGTVANLQAAQNQANQVRGIDKILRGVNFVGAGLTHAQHVSGDEAFQQNIKDADNIVSDFQARVAMQAHDPSSATSKGFQEYLKRFGISVSGDMSAEQAKQLLPIAFKQYEMDLTREATKAQREQTAELQKERIAATREGIAARAQTAQNQIGSRENIAGQKIEAGAEKAEDKKSADVEKSQNAAAHQTESFMRTARGNPEVSQALKDRYAASKAKMLLAQQPDYDKLSGQQVNLLVNEIAKIATGGVPTAPELRALNPGTLKGQLATTWSKLSNQPTPQNAGAFIKQYKSYLDDLYNNADKVVQTNLVKPLEANKEAMGEKHYKALHDQYVGSPEEEAKREPSGNASTKPAADPKVIQAYAKMHGIDMDAAKKELAKQGYGG